MSLSLIIGASQPRNQNCGWKIILPPLQQLKKKMQVRERALKTSAALFSLTYLAPAAGSSLTSCPSSYKCSRPNYSLSACHDFHASGLLLVPLLEFHPRSSGKHIWSSTQMLALEEGSPTLQGSVVAVAVAWRTRFPCGGRARARGRAAFHRAWKTAVE